MNVASLELCKELHELSGWTQPGMYAVDQDSNEHAHRYDLGYLLRRLPSSKTERGSELELRKLKGEVLEGSWQIGYDRGKVWQLASTPEDAAAKLCIELFKQGVLTRGGDAA